MRNTNLHTYSVDRFRKKLFASNDTNGIEKFEEAFLKQPKVKIPDKKIPGYLGIGSLANKIRGYLPVGSLLQSLTVDFNNKTVKLQAVIVVTG